MLAKLENFFSFGPTLGQKSDSSAFAIRATGV